jgi:hypothetical protein
LAHSPLHSAASNLSAAAQDDRSPRILIFEVGDADGLAQRFAENEPPVNKCYQEMTFVGGVVSALFRSIARLL